MFKLEFIVTGTVLCLGLLGTAEAQQTRPSLPSFLVPKEAAPAQVLPNAAKPPGGTLWHQLGIPQSMERMRKFRDSRVNRDGSNPAAERKPQLKPISHEDFLKPDADPILKKAAEAKLANDLAPQKIKALKYIASLGCGCSNQDFEDAVIAGMEDCVEDVRAAAVQAVITSASSSSCGTEACPNRRAGFLTRQQNGDPGSMPAVLHLSDCPPVGNGCATCGSCCTYNIQEKLKELAFKLDKDNCFVEPSAQVRALAEQALNLCPVREAPAKDEQRVDPGITEGPSAAGGADDKDPAKVLDGIRKLLEQGPNPEARSEARENDGARNGRGVFRTIDDSSSASPATIQVSSLTLDAAKPLRISDEVDSVDDYLLECHVVPQSQTDRLLLSFSPEYALPNDILAMAIDGSGKQQLCQISESAPGKVVIRTTDGRPFSIARTGTVQLGILMD